MRTNKTEKKQKLKESKGITLIALVITIIVLLILAGVTIATLTGDNGILKQTNKAKIENVKAGERDQIGLAYNAARTDKLAKGDSGNVLEGELEVALEVNGKATEVSSGTDEDGAYLLVKMTDTQNQYKVRNDGKIEDVDSLGGNTGGGSSGSMTVEDAKKANAEFTNNTIITDTYGNSITIPAGFKIARDSATDVTGGIVIEDATYTNTMGSQFVWIPVGTVYTKADKSESKTIELKRYTFADDGTPNSQEEGALIESYYKELESSGLGNTVAKDINAFKTKAVDSHGYYIGRYEARKKSNYYYRKPEAGSRKPDIMCITSL